MTRKIQGCGSREMITDCFAKRYRNRNLNRNQNRNQNRNRNQNQNWTAWPL